MKNKRHNQKTCFRCRLIDLIEEIHSANDPRFVLLAMAETSAEILSQLPEYEKMEFIKAINIMLENTSSTIH